MAQTPLKGIRVVEFAHMVMGPTCGLVLADLGAEVIKVEPLEGDNTRRLQGAGASTRSSSVSMSSSGAGCWSDSRICGTALRMGLA